MKPGQLFSHWEQVREGLLLTIDKFDDSELVFSPFKNSWPVGQIALHIADCEDHWIHGVVKHEINSRIPCKITDYPTKSDIMEILNRTHKKTISFLNSLDEKDLAATYCTPDQETFSLYWIIWHVIEHEIHHRGELSLIHGLLGREGLDV